MSIPVWTRKDHRRQHFADGGGGAPIPQPVGDPNPLWTKEQVVAWLASRGIVLEKKALASLSKSELLDMVADVLSPEPAAPTDWNDALAVLAWVGDSSDRAALASVEVRKQPNPDNDLLTQLDLIGAAG